MEGERLGIVEQDLIIQIILKSSFFKPYKLKLVTLDHPEELFALLNEIQEAYAGYELV
jgi:hypothetical protein